MHPDRYVMLKNEIGLSNEDDSSDEEEEFKCVQYFIFGRHNTFSHIWNFFEQFLCLASVYIYLLASCFDKSVLTYLDSSGNLELGVELFFVVNIVKKCMTDYIPVGHNKPERSLNTIAKQYLTTDFIFDFIPTIPFYYMVDESVINRNLLFFVKIIRAKTGLKIIRLGKWITFA